MSAALNAADRSASKGYDCLRRRAASCRSEHRMATGRWSSSTVANTTQCVSNTRTPTFTTADDWCIVATIMTASPVSSACVS